MRDYILDLLTYVGRTPTKRQIGWIDSGDYYQVVWEGGAEIQKVNRDGLPSPAPAPRSVIYSLVQADTFAAPSPLPNGTFIKRPSLCDYEEGAECDLPHLQRVELKACEIIRRAPHPNVAEYRGYVSDDGQYILGLAYKKYGYDLEDLVENPMHRKELEGLEYDGRKIAEGIRAGVDHLHTLGLAHVSYTCDLEVDSTDLEARRHPQNDLQPSNIMLDDQFTPVLIDFDAVKPIGTILEAGDKRHTGEFREDVRIATKEADLASVAVLEKYLCEGWRPDRPWMRVFGVEESV